MSAYTQDLSHGYFYHIFNRGINGCNLFNNENDYSYFLSQYERYINPIAYTYAWVLMPNHFHFLVCIKEDIVYKLTNADRSNDAVGFEINKWETVLKPDIVNDMSALPQEKTPNPTKHFSHLFNAYAKYFSKNPHP